MTPVRPRTGEPCSLSPAYPPITMPREMRAPQHCSRLRTDAQVPLCEVLGTRLSGQARGAGRTLTAPRRRPSPRPGRHPPHPPRAALT